MEFQGARKARRQPREIPMKTKTAVRTGELTQNHNETGLRLTPQVPARQ